MPSPVAAPWTRIDELRNVLGISRTLLLAEVGQHPGITGTQLASRCQLSASVVSVHARALRSCGLIDTARQGSWVQHSLTALGAHLLLGRPRTGR